MGRVGGDQQRAVRLERLAAAVEHETGEAHIVGALGVEDSAAGCVAQDGEAGHAFDMGAGFEAEPPGRIGAGGKKQRHAGSRGGIGSLLQGRRLVDGAAGRRDAIGAEGLRGVCLAGGCRARARGAGETGAKAGAEAGHDQFAAAEGHRRSPRRSELSRGPAGLCGRLPYFARQPRRGRSAASPARHGAARLVRSRRLGPASGAHARTARGCPCACAQ